MKNVFDWSRLSVRLVTSFLVVVLLTALAVGLPAIWLMINQLDRQAWSQVEQGERTAVSLYEKQFLELQNYAILTAQRPTLQELLDRNDISALTGYLETLGEGANLDLIIICRSGKTIAGTVPENPVCGDQIIEGFFLDEEASPDVVWIIARTAFDSGSNSGEVVVGIELDHDYAVEISEQIDLEHALFFLDQPVRTSLDSMPDVIDELRECYLALVAGISRSTCSLAGNSYFTRTSLLEDQEWSLVTAMDMSPISLAEKRLGILMTAAISCVAAVGTLLGVILSRRISRPLEKLSLTAGSFSRGDLETPFISESKVKEITRVTMALDDARIELLSTLRSLEGERDWSENLLSSIVEAIITLDDQGRINFFSHGAEQLTGLSAEDITGSHINEIFKLSDSEQTFYTVLSSELTGLQKADILLPDGKTVSCAITSAHLTRTGITEREQALVIRDISEEEAVHRLLGYFIANVAHELRTPLTALEASIELLMDPVDDLNPEEKLDLYNSLHLGILGLHTLVDNLLESANIEARRFRISPRGADLRLIVSEAMQTMAPLLLKYEQKLTVELPMDLPAVRVDIHRIVQVLVNLISNANKYGPPGKEICLEVTTNPQFVRLAVKDYGPGIPPEHHENMFRRFVFPQEDSEVSQAGAGLGLSVVKAIIEAHGGEVGVEDRPGGGSVFWFTLPIYGETL